VLNARDRFGAAALAPIAYNLVIIAAAIFLAPIMGVEGLAVGVVAGSVAHLLVQLSPLRSLGFRYGPVIDAGDAAARRALALMVPRAVGLGATQITFVVVTSLASTLGVGAVSALTIAFTLLQIPIGVIGVPLGVVLFPSMSREVASGNIAEFVHLLTRALRLLAFVMIPIAVLIALLRVEGIALLFRSFDPTAIDETAAALLAFLVGLVAHSLIAVLARAFYAQQDTLTPVLAAVGAVLVNTTLAIILVGPLGLPGIALAIAIAAWLEAGALALILRARLRTLSYTAVWRVAVRAVAATAMAAVVAFAVRQVVGGALVPDPTSTSGSSIVALVVTMVVTSLAFGLIFVVAALLLRIHELRSIFELMVHAMRRPGRA
jgi:putative peptidoglycan lipid II flippase